MNNIIKIIVVGTGDFSFHLIKLLQREKTFELLGIVLDEGAGEEINACFINSLQNIGKYKFIGLDNQLLK